MDAVTESRANVVREKASMRRESAAQDIHDEDLRIQAAAILVMFSKQA